MRMRQVARPKLARADSADSSKQDAVRIARRWRLRWYAALVIVGILTAWSRWPVARAQMFPFERNPAVPIDPRQAFVEGVRAVQGRDFPTAVGRLQLAVAKLPEVGDYALFYLGRAQEGNGDRQGAADAYRLLGETYPQSVLADAAGVDYARLELALGHPATAGGIAQRIADRTGDGGIDQNARLIIAQAAYAQHQFAIAYETAQALRASYPHGAFDAQARDLAYRILAANPDVGHPSTLRYHRDEAALLIQEGQRAAALAQVDRALTIAPSADLYWLRAKAVSGNDIEVRSALLRYLALAPAGGHAAAALKMLARQAWRIKDTAQARHYFGMVVSRFPGDSAEAMFEIGRTYEDDGDRGAARAEFQRLASRPPPTNHG
jgi:tetratricopeptide (TPR) repeat protein